MSAVNDGLKTRLSVIRDIDVNSTTYLKDEYVHTAQIAIQPNIDSSYYNDDLLIKALFTKKKLLFKEALEKHEHLQLIISEKIESLEEKRKNINEDVNNFSLETTSNLLDEVDFSDDEELEALMKKEASAFLKKEVTQEEFEDARNKYRQTLELSLDILVKEIDELKNKAENFLLATTLFEEIKKSENFKCKVCGFQDEFFLEIHHLDGNHSNNKRNNLIPCCTLCHRQHHLFWLATTDTATLGKPIPNIPQSTFNHFQRIAIVFETSRHKNLQEKLGITGVLGTTLIQPSITSFKYVSQSVYLSSEDFKQKVNLILENKKVKHEETKNEVTYSRLIKLLDDYESTNKEIKKNAQKKLDDYFGTATFAGKNVEQQQGKEEQKKEEYRANEILKTRTALFNVQINVEDDIFSEKQNQIDTYSIMELALSLAKLKYDVFVDLNLPLYVVYNEKIFCDAQKAYYLQLPYFNVEDWQLDSKISETVSTVL